MSDLFGSASEAIFAAIAYGCEVQFYGPVHGNMSPRIWMRVTNDDGDELYDQLITQKEIARELGRVLEPYFGFEEEEDAEVRD